LIRRVSDDGSLIAHQNWITTELHLKMANLVLRDLHDSETLKVDDGIRESLFALKGPGPPQPARSILSNTDSFNGCDLPQRKAGVSACLSDDFRNATMINEANFSRLNLVSSPRDWIAIGKNVHFVTLRTTRFND
jgi:hypothetical protein